jgi:hypothetical protein
MRLFATHVMPDFATTAQIVEPRQNPVLARGR